jgi:hypothetical protein
VRLDFALLSTLYGAGFLRHTNLLRAENVEQTPPILNVPELRIVLGAGLAHDLAQVVSEPIFDIPRLVRQAGVDDALGVGDRPFVELGDPGRERLYECI